MTMEYSLGASVGASRPPGNLAVGTSFILLYALAYLGLYTALLTPVFITLAVRIGSLAPQEKAAQLGMILGVGAFVALLANPVFGRLSDRTRTRWGRRRPWILGGAIVGSVAQWVMATNDSMGVMLIAWCAAQCAYNAALSALVAVVADRVPPTQRAKLSAITGSTMSMGILLGSGVVALTSTTGIGMFLVPAIIGLISLLLFVFYYKERPVSITPESWRWNSIFETFWLNPCRYPDFAWAWLSRFFVSLGSAVLMTYQVYYLTDHLHVSNDELSSKLFISFLLGTVCATVSALIAGVISDYLRRRKLFVLASALVYAAGMGIMVALPSYSGFLVGMGVSFVGLGIYMAVDQALVVEVLPDSTNDAGKNLGLINIANAVPQSLAPALAPLILAIGTVNGQNYPLLYTVAAVVAVAGAMAIIPVRGVR